MKILVGGMPNPKWLTWWPTGLGQSWLLVRLGLEKSFLGLVLGVLWLIAGTALIASGLGIFGFVVPAAWWRILSGAGAILSILLLLIYAHPFFLLGLGANLAVLIGLLWLKWPAI